MTGDPVNASGPPDTYGCACQDDDARECYVTRNGAGHPPTFRCDCLCHQWRRDAAERAARARARVH